MAEEEEARFNEKRSVKEARANAELEKMRIKEENKRARQKQAKLDAMADAKVSARMACTSVRMCVHVCLRASVCLCGYVRLCGGSGDDGGEIDGMLLMMMTVMIMWSGMGEVVR